MIFFAGPKLFLRVKDTISCVCTSVTSPLCVSVISAKKKHDSLRKFHLTYGLALENYLPDRANHYRKCQTDPKIFPFGITLMVSEKYLTSSCRQRMGRPLSESGSRLYTVVCL